ncbi:NAD(P)/FAD-dependent oxidoreductase [Sphingosinicella rhizophila]|uniref:FAD-binding oxidoreductase n=1 Tax=Sphingosinicella rhizophila TaxID=3050082 RepID=A0ABU3Q5S2_9SPHN|nr:FAD-binding oxidoreductase [Sphingosinicella sp. GR2756]MDT9598762.1 FAD-binding oxidoreductase [Sphingosinicella sp. GR2756]
MKKDQHSHGLWEKSAPPAPVAGRLVGQANADVAIIGGGYTGCSAALHLAEAGRVPIVLEARQIGFGGSGRNVGLVNAGLWVMPNDLAATLGDAYGERLLSQLSEGPDLVFGLIDRYGMECEAVRTGTLHCAVGRKGFGDIAERARQWKQRLAPVELLDAGGAARLVGSSAYSGALLDRRAGTIQPLAYARGLADHAMRQGARLFTDSPALAFEDMGGAWRVRTPEGCVVAPWIIIASDAYSTGPCRDLAREQVMLPYFNLATRPLGAALRASILPERQGAWDTNRILSSFRFDASGRLVFGSVGALGGTGGRVHAKWGQRALARIFPGLGDVRFEHGWYGQIGMTDDAVPRLHSPGRNMISISGFNGRGIAPGTSFGRDLARLVMGEIAVEDLSLPLTTSRAAPFRTAKSAFYELGAGLAHFAGSRFRTAT